MLEFSNILFNSWVTTFSFIMPNLQCSIVPRYSWVTSWCLFKYPMFTQLVYPIMCKTVGIWLLSMRLSKYSNVRTCRCSNSNNTINHLMVQNINSKCFDKILKCGNSGLSKLLVFFCSLNGICCPYFVKLYLVLIVRSPDWRGLPCTWCLCARLCG